MKTNCFKCGKSFEIPDDTNIEKGGHAICPTCLGIKQKGLTEEEQKEEDEILQAMKDAGILTEKDMLKILIEKYSKDGTPMELVTEITRQKDTDIVMSLLYHTMIKEIEVMSTLRAIAMASKDTDDRYSLEFKEQTVENATYNSGLLYINILKAFRKNTENPIIALLSFLKDARKWDTKHQRHIALLGLTFMVKQTNPFRMLQELFR